MIPAWVASIESVGDVVAFAQLAGGIECLRQTEVEHLDRAVRSHLDVGGLQITMNDSLSCAASSASAICLAIGRASSSGNAPSDDAIGQCRPFDEFHHQRGRSGGVFESVDVRDVRMIQRGEDLGFATEPCQPLWVMRERAPVVP